MDFIILAICVGLFFVISGVLWAMSSLLSSVPTPQPSPTSPQPSPTSPQPYTSTPQPVFGSVPNVIGLASPNSRVGTVTNAPNLYFKTSGSMNSTVRIRGTSLSINIYSPTSTLADVYVEFSNPFSGLIILEKTDGSEIARQYLTSMSGFVFRGVAS